MKVRADVDDWIDDKAEESLRRYFKLLGPGPYQISAYPDNEFISEKLRRYMFGLVRLIYNYHLEELGIEDITINDVLHEIEDALNPEYDIIVHSGGRPLSKWYPREALKIKDRLQALYGPRGLYLPDPNTNYKEDAKQ